MEIYALMGAALNDVFVHMLNYNFFPHLFLLVGG